MYADKDEREARNDARDRGRKNKFTPPPQAPELPSAEWFAQAFHDIYCRLEDVGKDFRTAKEREPFKTLLEGKK